MLDKKVWKFQITASIDAWGPEQEYVRWGIKLDHWESNFRYLLENPWLKININQTISPLTIKSMPALLAKLQEWRPGLPCHWRKRPLQQQDQASTVRQESHADPAGHRHTTGRQRQCTHTLDKPTDTHVPFLMIDLPAKHQ